MACRCTAQCIVAPHILRHMLESKNARIREAALRTLFPLADIPGAAGREPCDVLIAGCGTGVFALEFARAAPHARFLAIDLSLSSISYAKRMAQSLSVTNIEFAQADLLKLASIGRTFDSLRAVSARGRAPA